MAFTTDDFAGDRVRSATFDKPRAIVGAAQRLNLSKNQDKRVDKRAPTEWQNAAWRFFDTIGEVHFAFSLIGQVISRIRLYPGIVVDPADHPVAVDAWLEDMADSGGDADRSIAAAKTAAELLEDLVNNTPGGSGGLLRTLGMNLSIPGEAYLTQTGEGTETEWLILSSDEIRSSSNKWVLQRSRTSSKNKRELPGDTFVARIWRAHPRYNDEPDSSMQAVLDQCEQLVLLDQASRAAARRAMNAGIVFVPDGLSSFDAADEDDSIADALQRSALDSVTDEGAPSTVTPKVLQGPPELADAIKFIRLTESYDADAEAGKDKALARIMQGLDIPKDIVAGLADVKYSNAIVIDDNLYRTHIEPLILLMVDALTEIYMRPLLNKKLRDGGDIMDRIVVWYDPSDIVTRPDKSQAANEGFDKKLLSGEAWRSARGFTDQDAPDEMELLQRLALERAPIDPSIATALIEAINPEWFSQQRQQGAEAAGIPDDVASLLSPGGVGVSAPEEAAPDAPTGTEAALEGAEINPNGTMPPVR